MTKALRIAALTWVFAVTLGFWFAANSSGSVDPRVLLLPAVIPVVLISSTCGALMMFPLALWASRTGWENIRRYGPILWVTMAVYVFIVNTTAGLSGVMGMLTLGALGLIIVGLIPPRGRS